jgi:hypothetical protein
MTRPTIAAVEPAQVLAEASAATATERASRSTGSPRSAGGATHSRHATRSALLSAATTHDAWYEPVHAHKLSWDEAEQTLYDGRARALLNPNCAT